MTRAGTESPIEGGCHCGRCRVRIAGDPFRVSWCHCADCRRVTGAPATVFVGFPEDTIEYAGERPDRRATSQFAERLFCGNCGTPLAYRYRSLEGEIYFHVGVLDEPARFVPELHAWVSESLPWLELDDDLPRHEGFSRTR